METSLLFENTEIRFSHYFIRVCCYQLKSMSHLEDSEISSDEDSPFSLCSSSDESEVSAISVS